MSTPDPAARLRELILRPQPEAGEIAQFLDALSLAETVAAVRGLQGRAIQRALWNAAASNPPVTTAELVPPDYPPMKPVLFHGKNSLPAFTEFEKICCRPPREQSDDVLWGYNETWIKSLIGPGYYVVHDTPGHPLGGAAFDYRKIPDQRLAQWPELRPNSAGLARFIYNSMVDYMRRVSRRVFIGSATRGEREIGSYFVVARELD